MNNLEHGHLHPKTERSVLFPVTPDEMNLYKQKVGKMWRPGTSREITLAAIENPEAELARLGTIDAKEDREDTIPPHTGMPYLH